MNFRVDAQLPVRLADWLREAGHDARHALELPFGNRTPDSDIGAVAAREQRIVVTKDRDFVQSLVLTGEPALLLISTGNIANLDQETLLMEQLATIAQTFANHHFVELRRDALLLHR